MDPEEQALRDADASRAAFERSKANDFKSLPSEPIALEENRTEPYVYEDPRTAMQEGRITDIPKEPVYVPPPYVAPPRIDEALSGGKIEPPPPFKPTLIKESSGATRSITEDELRVKPGETLAQANNRILAQTDGKLIPSFILANVQVGVSSSPNVVATAALAAAGLGALAIQKSGIGFKLATEIERAGKELRRNIAASDLAISFRNQEHGENVLGGPLDNVERFKEGISLKAEDVRDNIRVFVLESPVKTNILDKIPTIEKFKQEGVDLLSGKAADFIMASNSVKVAVADKVTDLINQGIIANKNAEDARTWIQGRLNDMSAKDYEASQASSALMPRSWSSPNFDKQALADATRKAFESLAAQQAALDEARAVYVSSLNPSPILGDYSDAANAAIAAAGVRQELMRITDASASRYAQQAYDAAIKEATKSDVSPAVAAQQATRIAQQVYTETMVEAANQVANQVTPDSKIETKADTKAQTQTKEATRRAIKTLLETTTTTLPVPIYDTGKSTHTDRTYTPDKTIPDEKTDTDKKRIDDPLLPPKKGADFTTTKKEPTKKQLATAEAFPMGFGWWVTWGVGKKRYKKFYFGQKAPHGIKMVTQGKGEAARGIQQQKGDANVTGTLRLGVVTAKISNPTERPGRSGAISFYSRERNRSVTPKRPKIGR
jgi:hypothetical protein